MLVVSANQLRTLAIEFDTSLDLVELEEYKSVSLVTVGVVVSESLECLSILALVEKPPGGLRAEEHEDELEDGGETLKDGGDTPSPGVVDELRTEGRPGSTESRVSEWCVAEACEMLT